MAKGIANSKVADRAVRMLRRSLRLGAAWPRFSALVFFALGFILPAHAQTMLSVSTPSPVFPLTGVGQSNSQTLTLTASGVDAVDLWSAQIAPGYLSTNEYQVSIPSTAGCTQYLILQPGDSCNITVNFYPLHPGSGASPVPIARSAPLQLTYQYADPTLGWVYQVANVPLIGTGTQALGVMTPGLISDLVGSDATPKAGFAGDGSAAANAVFSLPGAIAVDGLGNIYIADTGNNVIRVVYEAGTIPNVSSPVAGNIYTIAGIAPTSSASTAGAGVDGGLATASPLNGPAGIALDAAGNLYIADTGNQAIRMVSATTGIITTVAGTLNNGGNPLSPGCCYTGDGGAATAAQLYNPAGLAVDGYGDIYIADSGNNAIRVVYVAGFSLARLIRNLSGGAAATAGDIYTIAGGANSGVPNNGDGGPATAGVLGNPIAVTVDSHGNFYIADTQDLEVRRVDGNFGILSTIYQGTVPALGLAVDASDDVYFPLQGTCSVLDFNPTTQQYISPPGLMTVAGNGSCSASADGGSATAAGLNNPNGVVVDGSGNLYLLEADGVRFVDGTQTGFNFGSVNVGNTSATLTAIVTDEDILYPDSYPLYSLQGYYLGYLNLTAPFATTPYVNANPNPNNANINSNDCSNNETNFALNPGQTCGASFVFQPIADSTGTPFTQTGYSGNNANKVQLTGTGTGPLPTVTLTGGPLNFTGVVGMGYGATQPLTLTNTSNVNLTIFSINPGQYTSGSFKESDNCGTLLAANSSCTISISFAATASGLQSMTLTVTDNASTGGGTQSASLAGTGTVPVASIGTATVNFPTQAPGTTSSVISVNITNTGNAPLTFCNTAVVPPSTSPTCFYYYSGAPIAAFTLSGNEPDQFSITATTCGATLAISAQCSVSVTFTPTMPGYFTGVLDINDNSGGTGLRDFYATQTVNLVGSGSTPVGRSSFTIGNAVFPSTPVGQSITQTVTVQLNSALALNSIAISSQSTEFVVGTLSGCVINGTTVNAAATICQVPVTFTPSVPGMRIAPLIVTTAENGGTPYLFALIGTGTGPLAALTPGIITHYVGSGGGVCTGVSGEDGLPAPDAFVGYLDGMTLDPAGNLYLSDSLNFLIWRIDTNDVIHMFAGSPGTWGCGGYDQVVVGNGAPALGGTVEEGGPMVADTRGGLYIGNDEANGIPSIRYVDPANDIITSVVGNVGADGTQGTGWMSNTHFYAGSIIQATVSGTAYLFTASIGGISSSTAPAFPATLSQTVSDGTVQWTNIGRVSGNSQHLTGGVGCPAQIDSYGNGCTGTNAGLLGVQGVAVDSSGDLFFSDWVPDGLILTGNGNSKTDYHSTVRTMNASTGIVAVFAGNGTAGHAGDGLVATNPSVEVSPGALAFDSKGDLYIVESQYIRRIDATTHIITTVAGNGSGHAFASQTCEPIVGDGGSAASAGFTNLTGIAFDAADDMYLVDAGTCAVRRVDSATQTITTIAGLDSGWNFESGDLGGIGIGQGSAVAASLRQPQEVSVDKQGNVYIMEVNGGVRKINVSQSVLEFSPYSPNQGIYLPEPIGSSIGPSTVTVVNAGNAGPLTFNSPFTDPLAYGISTADFTRDVSGPDCILNAATGLVAGTECPINIDFTPTVAGNPIEDTDQVTDNGAIPTQTITLYGTSSGPPAQVTLLPALLSFATAPNVTTAIQYFTLTNNTTTGMPINNVTLSGSGASVFVLSNGCTGTLAANASCQIGVAFAPTVAGQYIATVNVSDVVSSAPATQSAGLTGLAGTPNAIMDDELDFGNQIVNTTSPVKTVTLRSTGTVPLLISSITLGGASPGQFAISSTTCGSSLAPTAQCTISVTFTPTSASPTQGGGTVPFLASIQVADNASNSPQSAILRGIGTAAAGAVSVNVSEVILLTDTPTMNQVAWAKVNEVIHTTDSPAENLSAFYVDSETIHVTDAPAENLSAFVFDSEVIHTTDTPAINLSRLIIDNESIHTADSLVLKPSTLILDAEHITTTDSVLARGAALIKDAETIHTTDTPTEQILTSPTTTVLTSTTATPAAGNPVAFTATVSSTGGTPTGNVTFYDGTNALTTVSLTGGIATYTTSSLSDGAHSISAVYAGTALFLTSTSNTLTEAVTDFTLSFTSTGGAGVTLTILPGESGTYTITLNPPNNGYTGTITLSASGLPAGATATFSPNPVTLAGTAVTSTLTITIPPAMAQAQPEGNRPMQGPLRLSAMLLGLLLPLIGMRRAIKRSLLSLMAMALLAICICIGITSCGGDFFTQAPRSYVVTITATSGTDQHSGTINLNVP